MMPSHTAGDTIVRFNKANVIYIEDFYRTSVIRSPIRQAGEVNGGRAPAMICSEPPMRLSLSVTVCLALCLPALATDPQMTAAERAKLTGYLRDSQKEFLSYVEGVSEEQWRWKAAPDRWSVGETAEHIVLSEGFLFDMAQKALASEPNPDWEVKTRGKTELLERALPDRSHKVQAPEPIKPEHLTLNRDQVIARFKELRARTIEFAETTQLPLKEHTTAGPFPVFDPLNAYQFLLYIPLHTIRHDKQIAEVKATPGYPKQI